MATNYIDYAMAYAFYCYFFDPRGVYITMGPKYVSPGLAGLLMMIEIPFKQFPLRSC